MAQSPAIHYGNPHTTLCQPLEPFTLCQCPFRKPLMPDGWQRAGMHRGLVPAQSLTVCVKGRIKTVVHPPPMSVENPSLLLCQTLESLTLCLYPSRKLHTCGRWQRKAVHHGPVLSHISACSSKTQENIERVSHPPSAWKRPNQ